MGGSVRKAETAAGPQAPPLRSHALTSTITPAGYPPRVSTSRALLPVDRRAGALWGVALSTESLATCSTARPCRKATPADALERMARSRHVRRNCMRSYSILCRKLQ